MVQEKVNEWIKFENDVYGEICKATAECGYQVNIDKEELIKALNYDREQYEKGFYDGFSKAMDIYEKAYKKVCRQLAEKTIAPKEYWEKWGFEDD